MTTRIAVLASGGGSNLQALLDYLAARSEARAGEVALVASDRRDAGALERARACGVPQQALDIASRSTGLLPLLREYAIELVVLAGYRRFVPNDVTTAFRGQIVNVHPALLPAFGGPGMFGEHVHAAVIASGARLTGVTVHFVDEHYDHGPIIAQWPVPVLHDDTPKILGTRVLAVEHALYPRVVQAIAAGDVRLGPDGNVHGWGTHPAAESFVLSSNATDTQRAIESMLDWHQLTSDL
jgi:formyltetrahydrofolate-dependent phosphoribosylglycinamide formyltransferase